MKQQLKPIVDIDEFDETVSLWQLLPCGNGYALKMLKYIADFIFNAQNKKKNVNIFITGKQGKKTHGRAFLRALGIETITEIPAELLKPATGICSFFDNPHSYQGYIISEVEKLQELVQNNIYEILQYGKYQLHNFLTEGNDTFMVPSSLILTGKDKNGVASSLVENVDYIVELGEYTEQQLILIVLQRLKYCHIEYSEEEVLQFIVKQGENNLHKMVNLLKVAMTIMNAEGKNTLMIADIKKALLYI